MIKRQMKISLHNTFDVQYISRKIVMEVIFALEWIALNTQWFLYLSSVTATKKTRKGSRVSYNNNDQNNSQS